VAIFVDTGAWYAVSVPSDADHLAATTFMRSNVERLVTSDFIYDELLTLFRSRGHEDRAKDWVAQVQRHLWDVVRVTPADIQKATEVFFAFNDKHWSFTDCTSRVVIERLGIRTAFAFDDHFHQFGTVIVAP
jgi:predicted nucleic acid-binding protein